MKRALLIGLTVLMAVACKKVTIEERIDSISAYFSQHENPYVERLEQLADGQRIDYLTYTLLKDLRAREAWILDEGENESLVAAFPSRKAAEGQLSAITVSLDDPAACAAALHLIKACKDLKIKSKNNLRVLFYAPAPDSAGKSGLVSFRRDLRDAGEIISLDIHLTSLDSLPPHTFVIEENPGFVERFLEVIPPYFKPLGEYSFIKGTYPNPDWPLNTATCRYNLDAEDLQNETAAVTILSFLLN